MRPRHILVATLVAAIWGFNFVTIAVGVDAFPPLLFAALRFACAFFPAVLFVGRPCVSWRWLLTIGLTLGAGQYATLFVAVHLGLPSGLSSVVLQSQALFTIAIAAATLGERVTRRQVLGLLVAVAGMVAIGVTLGEGSPLPAFLLCVAAAASWSVGNVAIRAARPPNTLNLMVWISAFPPLPLLGLSLLFEGPGAATDAFGRLDLAGLGSLAYIAYAATLCGFGLWGWLMQRYDAGVVAPYSLLVPVFSLTATAVFLRERMSPAQIGAAVLVIAGVAIASLRPGRRAPEPAETAGPPATPSTTMAR